MRTISSDGNLKDYSLKSFDKRSFNALTISITTNHSKFTLNAVQPFLYTSVSQRGPADSIEPTECDSVESASTLIITKKFVLLRKICWLTGYKYKRRNLSIFEFFFFLCFNCSMRRQAVFISFRTSRFKPFSLSVCYR